MTTPEPFDLEKESSDLVEHLNMAFVLGSDKSGMYEIIGKHFKDFARRVRDEAYETAAKICDKKLPSTIGTYPEKLPLGPRDIKREILKLQSNGGK